VPGILAEFLLCTEGLVDNFLDHSFSELHYGCAGVGLRSTLAALRRCPSRAALSCCGPLLTNVEGGFLHPPPAFESFGEADNRETIVTPCLQV
jgi:hypothetical protein